MRTKRLVLMALLTAIALTIFWVEQQFPLPIPIPGIKLGLSNIVTLFAIVFLGWREAAVILIMRITLGAIFTGQPVTFFYSMAGGICCLMAELLLYIHLKNKFIWAISAVGAMVHNIAQLFVAVLVTKTLAIFWYLPFLLIAGIISGIFTGLCVQILASTAWNSIHRLLR